MNLFVGVYLVLLFTNVCLFVQVYIESLFTNAGQSWSKLVHHDRGYWSDKHDETRKDAPNLNKKMRRCWFCWSRFSPMRFCPSQLPRSEPPVVSQRSQMSNQSHPTPGLKHGLSWKFIRWTKPTILQRKLAATMTQPQPPSGGGGGAFPKSFFESSSFNWGKVISGDRPQRFY